MVRANQQLQPPREPLAGWITAPETAAGELELVGLSQAQHPLAWQTNQAVGLLRNVMRLTAPNPGVMTGPGTNSYLVGQRSTGFIVIDPGPADADHLQRLLDATQGDIRAIVCTHSHPDHAPGARPLQALCKPICDTQARALPPVLGLPSAPTARAASAFEPDRSLLNQEQLILSGYEDGALLTHTLHVIHSPGHAANHLCLVLLEDGLLFSGDHILNGSTTVVDPPDGNMTDYLDSLDTLSQACDLHGIAYILPAHGYVLAQAKTAIARLKAHRLQREAKIKQVMQALPQGSLEDWLSRAYDDVPPRIWPVAKRSLLAHVERLQTLDAARGLSAS
jgi:recombination protein RecT